MQKKTAVFGLLGLLALAGVVSAEDVFKLKNGKVLYDPYIIEQTPDGITVGHREGCMLIKYKDMTEDYQKKFHYDPQKARVYEENRAQKENARKNEQQQKTRELESYAKRQSAREHSDAVFNQQQRIERIKQQISDAESDLKTIAGRSESDRKAGLQIATTPVGSNRDGRGVGNVWGWGESYRDNSASREVSAHRHEAAKLKRESEQLDIEYRNKRSDLENLKLRLEREERTLNSMRKSKHPSVDSKPEKGMTDQVMDWFK